jgi:hypothetical protein
MHEEEWEAGLETVAGFGIAAGRVGRAKGSGSRNWNSWS